MNFVAKLEITPDSFSDLNKFCKLYESYFFLTAANILIYMFSVIEQVSHFSDDVRIVSQTIITYIGNIFEFAIGFGLLFTLFSAFVAFQMFGDFNVYYYKDLKFIFLKILGMYFRGSMDNVDSDKSLDRYRIDSNLESDQFRW
jgi:hypothetical protein